MYVLRWCLSYVIYESYINFVIYNVVLLEICGWLGLVFLVVERVVKCN